MSTYRPQDLTRLLAVYLMSEMSAVGCAIRFAVTLCCRNASRTEIALASVLNSVTETIDLYPSDVVIRTDNPSASSDTSTRGVALRSFFAATRPDWSGPQLSAIRSPQEAEHDPDDASQQQGDPEGGIARERGAAADHRPGGGRGYGGGSTV